MDEYKIKDELDYHKTFMIKKNPCFFHMPQDFDWDKLNELQEVKDAGVYYLRPNALFNSDSSLKIKLKIGD
jgi:hypothetical protein